MKKHAGDVDICGIPFAVYVADEKGHAELATAWGLCVIEDQAIFVHTGMGRGFSCGKS